MVGPTLAALGAFAVLPDEVPETGLDLREFYFDNRRYIAVILALIGFLDVIWTIRWATIMNALYRPDFWLHFAPVALVNSVLILIVYFSERWRVQLVSLIIMLGMGHFAFGGWYIEALPGK